MGDTLDAYLPSTEALERVTINGGVILPDQYDRVRPQAGDEIWLMPAWGTGLEALWVPLVIGLAVGILGSVVQHFLFKPKPILLPQQNSMTEATEERTFSFEGIRTAIGPGGAVPVVYGRHRIGGQLLAAAVDQAYVVVDSPVTAIPGIAVTNVYHTDPQNIVIVTAPGNDFVTNEHIRLEGIVGKPALNTTWQIRKLDGDPDSFVLLFSWNTNVESAYGGGGQAFRADQGGTRTYQAITNPPSLSLFLGLCEGPVAAIRTDTMLINGQPIQNFPGIQVWVGMGSGDQPAFADFGGARNTFADGRVISPSVVTYTSNGPLHAFVLNLSWDQGLYFINEKGEKESNSVYFEYRYAPAGTGNWSPVSPFTISADRTAPVRIGIRREGLPFQAYDIQIARGGVQHEDEVRARWEPTLESVTEYLPNFEAYPYTAWLAIRALATDQLRGALPNITLEVYGRQVRVGSLVPVETWTDNPAWCVLDALTNQRYGRGVPDSDINLTAFAQYAAYCDQVLAGEQRHRLNIVLDRETRAQQFFLETMGGSRGLLLKSAGLWTPRPTMIEAPVCLLSWTMVSNVTLTYLRDVDAVNVMEARFSNEDAEFEQDVITWPAIAQWPAEVHKASIDLRGITKPSRIIRALQFELNRRRYENILLELDASAEAMMLQIHDLFRFSHPLPGWGTSGRLLEGSTTTVLQLDQTCLVEAGQQYVVYVRHTEDSIEVRNVLVEVLGEVTRLTLTSPLAAFPVPHTSVFIFGHLSSEANTRIFRVTALQRKSDTTVHLEAVIHNPSIYDEPVASPLPVITDLFNPLGPPPPLVSLIATELTRIQTSGASLRVVNLSWDVAQLSSGYAPYGGASILRRTVLTSGQLGQAQAGTSDLGAIVDPNDANVNYVPLAQVRGHVLDFDDYTVISGGTYQYRVVPVSPLGVPNNVGAREVLIHVAGPTTSGFFPGTVRNLRLKGQAVGVTTWEGRDCHVEWDSVAPSALFTDTFFVQDYVLQIWAPGQLYLMRATTVLLSAPGQSVQFTYTYEQNYEDQVRSNYTSARRDFEVWVWARTNTGLMSLDPAHIYVINPPPDMSEILPDTTPLFEAALINFNQWVEPRDLHHYEVYLDTVNPPVAIYQDVSIAFRKLAPVDLIPGTTYYTYILPYDTFGAGIASQTASFTPVALDASKLDTVPPAVPTGLVLTTGSAVGDDGTVETWVEAAWNPVLEEDVAGYQLSLRFPPSDVPTVVFAGRTEPRYRLLVPGGVEVFAKIAAYDRTMNISAFSAEVTITTGADTTPPGIPSNLTAIGGVQKVHLLWTPPADLDYDYGQVWAAASNDRTLGSPIGSGSFSAEHQGLGANDTRYYWVRAVDRSGNTGPFFPAGETAGIAGTAGQLDTTFISSLAADKILAGTITALVRIGVANLIDLDGVNQWIAIRQPVGGVRVLLGRLGVGGTEWGLRVFNETGQVMFDATQGGVTTVGITTGAISASHLRTDTAVITVAAQIANATIETAHVRELSASKIAAGQLAVQVAVGGSSNLFGSNIFLDGAQRGIFIYDEATQIRVRLGKLDAANYGLQIWNSTGGLMWDFESGAQTLGLADLAVTNAKIGNLSASKINTGAITFQMAVGSAGNGLGTNIFIDGINNDIIIFDDFPRARVQLGKLGPGLYGLMIWDDVGNPMWNFSNGAQTRGIAPNAVTESLMYNSVGSIAVTTSETEIASRTFTQLNAGDQVLLTGTITATVTGGRMRLRLREDSVGGPEMHQADSTFVGTSCLTVQGVFNVGSTITNKKFLLSIANVLTGDSVAAEFIMLTTLRRQR